VNEPVTTEHPSVKKDFGARAALWELRGIDACALAATTVLLAGEEEPAEPHILRGID
jgi:hypothetical protein